MKESIGQKTHHHMATSDVFQTMLWSLFMDDMNANNVGSNQDHPDT